MNPPCSVHRLKVFLASVLVTGVAGNDFVSVLKAQSAPPAPPAPRLPGALPPLRQAQVLGPGGRKAAENPRIREAILAEGKLRLQQWYQNKTLLQLPMWRDGVKVQLSNADVPCGAPGDVEPEPVSFGDFNISGVRPIDVFNTLVDVERQMEWDQSISSVNLLGDWPDEGVQGLNYVYPTGVTFIADREIFEWAAYEADFAKQEFFVAFSSLANARLHDARVAVEGTVHIENCLGAYWIRPHSGGGAQMTFTHHLNSHPPLSLSPRFVFSILWNRDVDWVNTFKEGCRATARRNGSLTETHVADWLLQGPPLPVGDPNRMPMSCFNLTEEGIYKVEIGAKQSEVKNYLTLSVVVVIMCFLVCLLTRLCFRSRGYCKSSSGTISSELEKDNELGEQEDSQGSSSASDDESSEVYSQSRRNCRCLSLNQ
jgi:hypothetical protein